jgi:DNA-binding NtrC family response regulator
MNDTLSGDHGRAEPAHGAARSAQEFLFLVLNCDEPNAHHLRISLKGVNEILIGRGDIRDDRETDVRRLPGAGRIAIGIPDAWCSKQQVLLSRTAGGWVARDLQSKNGSFIAGARFQEARLRDRAALEVGRTIFLYRDLPARPNVAEADLLCQRLSAPHAGPDLFRTLSPQLQHQLQLLRRAAPSALPVLVHGESGTGKEVAARAIHELSGRRGPFIAVNCGALSPGLLESELFGHVRGAFSGATEHRAGLVRAAHQGTLFLDELAEAPPAVQVRLLRVLQEREVLAVGATTPVPVDARVIAATHGDVHAMAARGEFRPDFLARLTGFEIRLPPLRDRPEDIGHLAAGFLRATLGDGSGVTFDNEVGRALLRYHWPLNLRELERVISAAAVLAVDGRVSMAAFADRLERLPDTGAPSWVPTGPPPPAVVSDPRGSRAHLLAALRAHQGNISGTARALCTSRTHVRRLMARYRISSGELGES